MDKVFRFHGLMVLTTIIITACSPSQKQESTTDDYLEVTSTASSVSETADELTADYFYDLAEAAYNDGQYMQAVKYCTRAIEIDPQFASAYWCRGVNYAEVGEYDKAIEDFTKAIEIAPDYAFAYYNRGNLYADLMRFDEAIADYTEAINIDPQFSYAYYERGNVYADLGRYEEAIADFNAAIEIDPSDPLNYINRGGVYFDLEQYEKAVGDYTKAIKLDPTYARGYYNRGTSYTRLEKYELAIDDLSKAIDLNPQYAEAYQNRGLAYQSLGKQEEADADFKKFNELTGTPIITHNESIITVGTPDNPNEFTYQGAVLTPVDDENKINAFVTGGVNETPVAVCPEIWVASDPTETVPTYFVFVGTTQVENFAMSIRSTASDSKPDGVVGYTIFTPRSFDNVVSAIQYKPAERQSVPNEFEIQVGFTGCEIYRVVVPWP